MGVFGVKPGNEGEQGVLGAGGESARKLGLDGV